MKIRSLPSIGLDVVALLVNLATELLEARQRSKFELST